MFKILKDKCLKDNVPIIKEKAEHILLTELKQNKPKNIVEIGTAVGYSSLIIGNTIKEWNGILTTFEVSYPSYMEALDNFYNYGGYNINAYNVDPLSINIEKIFQGKKIDFLFIDAVMKFYLDFFLAFEDLLESNCIILMDNIIKFKSKTGSLYKFLNENQIEYKIFDIPPNDGIMKIVKK